MTECPNEPTLQAWLDGEMSAADAERVRLHVDACAACAARVRDAKDVWSLIGTTIQDSAGDAVPTARLAASIEEGIAASRQPRFSGHAMLRSGWAAAAAAVVVVGLLALLFHRQQGVPPAPPDPTQIAASSVPDEAPGSSGRPTRLESQTSRHLERTQLLLRSVRNTQAVSASELEYERALSRELLTRNRLLRRRAAWSGDAAAEEVLVHVEPLLLDIANLPDHAASDQIASLQSLIRAQGVIAELRLYTSLIGS